MNIELLAPAGSYDSMLAAFNAGADAVYIGGNRFGARAFADNLDEEQLLRAIDHAHLHDKKLFLTVNTLLKDKELDSLYEYLNPYYREGLDAVIVQDLGVFSYIKDQFPGMDIHASTQMTVTGVESAEYLYQLGASRVVTAREMSLKEIAQIHERIPVEIETFVHGALCFCYSGQCLLSSMIGGRSGNRGRCAQPCRLPYEVYEKENRISTPQNKYLMSPKDMCSLHLIPELIESGIYSFKMEGRMKKPEYTAGITSIYRKYIDLYAEKGKNGFKVEEADMNTLMDLYNRGGFTEGYFRNHNGKEMMSLERPNHRGTKAVRVISASGSLKGKALEALNPKDIVEVPGRKEAVDVTISQTIHEGQTFSLAIPKDASIKKDTILYRTRNQKLIDTLTDSYIKRNSKVKIKGNLILSAGESAMMTLSYGDITVSVSGETVQPAQKRPLSKEDAAKQICKTGQSSMEFEELNIEIRSDVFVSMQGLNELRRNGIAKLEEAIWQRYKREERSLQALSSDSLPENIQTPVSLSVSVETMQQYELVLKEAAVKRIYLSYAAFDGWHKVLTDAVPLIETAHQMGKELYLVTPWIHRQEKNRIYDMNIEILSQFDGILCKSLETYAVLRKAGYEKPVIADYNLYSFNDNAKAFLLKEGFVSDTLPVELKYSELAKKNCVGSEIIIYGYLPLMISAQCFRRNTKGCDRKTSILSIRDRKGMYFPVKNLCGYCCNIIYNSSPLELIDQIRDIRSLNVGSMRLSFTVEEGNEVKAVLRSYVSAFENNLSAVPVHDNFTRGHFKRGVE